MSTAHERARRDLPEHLRMTDDGKIECRECGEVGLRPMSHTDACSHEYQPTREGGDSDAW